MFLVLFFHILFQISAIDIKGCPQNALILQSDTVYNIFPENCTYQFQPDAFVFANIDNEKNYDQCETCFRVRYKTFYQSVVNYYQSNSMIPAVNFELQVDLQWASEIGNFSISGVGLITQSTKNYTISLIQGYATQIRAYEMSPKSLYTVNAPAGKNISVRATLDPFGYIDEFYGIYIFSDTTFLGMAFDVVFAESNAQGPLRSTNGTLTFVTLDNLRHKDMRTILLVNYEDYGWSVDQNQVSLSTLPTYPTYYVFGLNNKPRIVHLLSYFANTSDILIDKFDTATFTQMPESIEIYEGCIVAPNANNLAATLDVSNPKSWNPITMRGPCKTLYIPPYANVTLYTDKIQLGNHTIRLKGGESGLTMTRSFPYADRYYETAVENHQVNFNLADDVTVDIDIHWGLNASITGQDCFLVIHSENGRMSQTPHCSTDKMPSFSENKTFYIVDLVDKDSGGYMLKYNAKVYQNTPQTTTATTLSTSTRSTESTSTVWTTTKSSRDKLNVIFTVLLSVLIFMAL